MLIILLTSWVTSVIALVGYSILVTVETRRGARFGVTTLRSNADSFLGKFESILQRGWAHFVRYIVQLHWHYGIHALYRSGLLFLQHLYQILEEKFEHNRQRTKWLRAEKRRATTSPVINHLETMVAHKEATALTVSQKKALKKKSLERQ